MKKPAPLIKNTTIHSLCLIRFCLSPFFPNHEITFLGEQGLCCNSFHEQILYFEPLVLGPILHLHSPNLSLRLSLHAVVSSTDGFVRDVGQEVVPYWLAGGVDRRVGLNVGRYVEGTNGKCDDGGVPFRNELVSGEALDMEKKKWGKGMEEAIAFASVEMFLCFQTVIFG